MVDYSKWKDIEVSDDEDDTHPNIDTPSLFRWRHQARVERMEEMEREKQEFQKRKETHMKRVKEVKDRKAKGEDIKELEEEVKKEGDEIRKIEADIEKKERLTPWNVDTIASEKFSKTIINTPKPKAKEEETEEQKAIRFKEYVQKYEGVLKKYGMLQKYDDTKKFLMDHPELVCEDTGNFLVYWCIDLAMEEKFNLMDHVSHQCIAMQFLLELAKQLDRDPRSCIQPFFNKIGHAQETDYKDAFSKELEAFRNRIRRRAEEKIAKAMEEERQERLGPGGLDPLEVIETLPQELKDCFESQDISLLQKVIAEMDPEEAQYHMKRCVDSGLWVPGPSDSKTDIEEEPKPSEDK